MYDSGPLIGPGYRVLSLPLFCLHSRQLGLACGDGAKLMQQTVEHGSAMFGLPECHADTDEHVDDFPVAGLHHSFEYAEGQVRRVGGLIPPATGPRITHVASHSQDSSGETSRCAPLNPPTLDQ